jgi:cell division cycle 20-like protein 1 (cofactor of APC complex)
MNSTIPYLMKIHFDLGTHRGHVHLYDVTTRKRIQSICKHTNRVGVLAWNDWSLCSGSRDRSIIEHDIRQQSTVHTFHGHTQEICGLKWSPDKSILASGGNDNHLYLWSKTQSSQPLHAYNDHIAAVKAIAWSPHQHGLLASGGGTADRHIRFRSSLTCQTLSVCDTGSQVCQLIWSKNSPNELASTHGYSQNQIVVWKYPTMQPLAKLLGHQQRVLYLAMSPDGESIVTGAGDETLRFWNVFAKAKCQRNPDSKLNGLSRMR